MDWRVSDTWNKNRSEYGHPIHLRQDFNARGRERETISKKILDNRLRMTTNNLSIITYLVSKGSFTRCAFGKSVCSGQLWCRKYEKILTQQKNCSLQRDSNLDRQSRWRPL